MLSKSSDAQEKDACRAGSSKVKDTPYWYIVLMNTLAPSAMEVFESLSPKFTPYPHPAFPSQKPYELRCQRE